MFEDLEKEIDYNDPVPVTKGLIKMNSAGKIVNFDIIGLEIDVEFKIQLYIKNLEGLKDGDIVKKDSNEIYIERKQLVKSW